ncbi:MAG: long-chain-fatty-acid--CoA ligase [Solirubrobacteraceae bacterium]|nr:long-chain-fatty-acid--CoA ligase [Solirubrobacteraceae bacterium]
MPTIPGTLSVAARRTPDREALVFDGRRRTYAELDRDVTRTARVLADRGVRPGDRVALVAGNSDRFVVAFYAASRAGAIVVPVNPALAPPEITHVLNDSGSGTVLVDPALAPKVVPATAAVDGDVSVLALGEADGLPDLLAVAEGTDDAPLDVEVAESDDALVIYTSGTTGKPKGVLLDHHRSIWVAVNSAIVAKFTDGGRFLHVAPLYHAAQLGIMLVSGTMLSATHVVLPGFDPEKVLDAMERERITSFFGVPTMFELLLRHPSLPQRDLSAWQTGMFGAAPMPSSTVERLLESLPDVELMQLCGQTEAGPGGIYSTFEDVKARPAASGRWPLPNTEARVVDQDGRPVAPDGVGELLLRGETIMKGYWRNPEATADTIRDGWLHTGDLARVDADGYITLVDRAKDMIITGGRNVYSIEVENAVATHPDVVDVAVVGRPHDVYGESIVAVVTVRPGAELDLEGLRSSCAELIADYKLPHDLVLDVEIPRNASGKVLKRELRDRIATTTAA